MSTFDELNKKLFVDEDDKKKKSFNLDFLSATEETEEVIEEEANNLWAAFGKGAIRGASFGIASGDAATKEKFSDMSGMEKGAYVAGEGLTMLAPFGALGKIGRTVASFGKYGVRGATRAASKKLKTEVVDNLGVNRGILAQATKIAKAEGKNVNDVIKKLGDDVQFSLSNTMGKMNGPYMDNLYQLAQSKTNVEAFKQTISNGAKGLLSSTFKKNGVKIAARQLDDLSLKFADQVASGARYYDVSSALASGLGRMGLAKDAGWVARTFGEFGNLTAIGFLHGIASQYGTKILRGEDHYGNPIGPQDRKIDFKESAKAGFMMGIMFPAVHMIPNIGLKGSGHKRLYPLVKNYINKYMSNGYRSGKKYQALANKSSRSARALLKLKVRGIAKDVDNQTIFGNALFQGKNKAGSYRYKGAFDITSKADKMPIEDVVSLLTQINRKGSAHIARTYRNDYIKDIIGSMPRIGVGLAAFHAHDLATGKYDDMSNEEFVTHLLMTAGFTRGRGSFGRDMEANYMMDFKPYVENLNLLKLNTKQLNDYINVHDPLQGKKVQGAGIRDTQLGKDIRNNFEEYDVDILPDEKIKNGYDPVRHQNIEKLTNYYDAMRQEEAGFATISQTDIKTKGLSAAELDNLNNNLGSIKVKENGKQLKDVSTLEIESYLQKEIGKNIESEYINLMEGLRDLGLNIQEAPSPDGSKKFRVKEIEGNPSEDIGIFQNYNDVIRALSENSSMIEIMQGVDPYQSVKSVKKEVMSALESTESNLNKSFGLPPIHRQTVSGRSGLAENEFMDVLKRIRTSEGTLRLTEILEGRGVNQTDKNFSDSFRKAFNVGQAGKLGFHDDIDMYKIDDIGPNPKYSEQEMKTILRPLYQAIKLTTDGIVDTNTPKKIPARDFEYLTQTTENILNSLSVKQREAFKLNDNNVFTEAILNNQGLAPRKINAVVDLVAEGIGNWSVKDKKLEVPDLNSIENMLKDMYDVSPEDAVKGRNIAADIYDSIGGNLLSIKPRIFANTLSSNYKTPDLKGLIKIRENLRLKEVESLIQNSSEIIESLSSPSAAEKKYVDVVNLLGDIALDPLNKNLDAKLVNLSKELNNLYNNNPNEKLKNTIDNLDKLQDDFSKVTDGSNIDREAVVINDKGNIKNTVEFLNDLLNTAGKNRLETVELVKNIVYNYKNEHGRDTSIRLTEEGTRKLRFLLTKKEGKDLSLKEIVENIQQTGSWNDANDILKITKEYAAKIAKSEHKPLDDPPPNGIDRLESLSNDKTIHGTSETLQVLSQRFFLNDPVKTNEIDNKIETIINDHEFNKLQGKPDDVVELISKEALDRIDLNYNPKDPSTQSNNIDLKNNWEMIKYKYVNDLLNRRKIEKGSIITDGENSYLDINSYAKGKNGQTTEWMFDIKGFEAIQLESGIIKPGLNKKLQKIQHTESSVNGSDRYIDGLLETGLKPLSSKTDRDIKSSVIRDGKIDKDKLNNISNIVEDVYQLSNKSHPGFFIQLGPGKQYIFKGGLDNVSKINNTFTEFYNNKLKDLKAVKVKDSEGTERRVPASRLRKILEQQFGDLEQTSSLTINQKRLKVLAQYQGQYAPRLFAKRLAAIEVGNELLRSSIESKMIKYGWTADGDMGVRATTEVINSLAKNHYDPEVRKYNQDLINNNYKKKVIIYNDEAPNAGTSIKERSLEFYGNLKKTITSSKDKSQKDFDTYINDRQIETINNDLIPSLDNALTDGIRYPSLRETKSRIAMKGGDIDVVAGEKTATAQYGEDGLLVKGYSGLDKDIASYIPKGYDEIIGVSAAKDYSLKVEPLDISGYGKEWYKALKNVDPTKNVIEVDVRNENLAHLSKSPEGVLLSSSMQDYEPLIYKKTFQRNDVTNIDRTISTLDMVNRYKSNSKELLPFLKQLNKDEGFTHNSGDRGLLSNLIEFTDIKFENPIIRDLGNRTLKDKFIGLLSKNVTPYGKDGTIIPDSNTNLKMPEFIDYATNDTPTETSARVNKTFGEISISNQDLNIVMPRDNSRLSFTINYKGIDFILNPSKGKTNISETLFTPVNNNKWRIYSPALDTYGKKFDSKKYGPPENPITIKSFIKIDRLAGKNAPDVPDYIKNSKKTYKEASKSVEKLMRKILQYRERYRDQLTYKDLVTLLEGGTVNMNNKILSLSNHKQSIKDFNVSLGGTGIAIPLKLYDKTFQRIVKPHNSEGIVKINHYDERVVHQRDNDGDKFFTFFGLPASMNTRHIEKQAFFRDFYTYKKESANNNIYGNSLDRNNLRAGESNVGISKSLDQLQTKVRGIGTTISNRKAADILATLGFSFTQNGKRNSAILDFSKLENQTSAKGNKIKQTGYTSQSVVDYNDGTANVLEQGTLKNFHNYSEKTVEQSFDNMKINESSARNALKTKEGMFGEFGKSNRRGFEIERDIIDISLRTVKKMGLLGTDVFQDGNQRSPEAHEIMRGYNDLKSFLLDPNAYLYKSLVETYAVRKNKQKLIDLFDYMMLETGYENANVRKTAVDQANKAIQNGKLPDIFKLRQNTTFSFKNFPKVEPAALNKKLQNMFFVRTEGKILYNAVKNDLFRYDKGMNGTKSKAHKALGRVTEDVLSMIDLAEFTGKSVKDLISEDNKFIDIQDFAIQKNFPNQDPNVREQYAMDQIKGELYNMYNRYNKELDYFSEYNIRSSDNKIARLQYRINKVHKALSVIEGKEISKIVEGDNINKTKANVFTTTKKKVAKVQDEVFVYSFKGVDETNLVNKIKDGELNFSDSEIIGFVSKGDKYTQYSNRTYVEIKQPIKSEKASNVDNKYGRALHQVGEEYKLGEMFNDPIFEELIINRVEEVKREINNNYRGAKKSATDALRNNIWQDNNLKTESILKDYFNEKTIEEVQNLAIVEPGGNFTREQAVALLTRQLIKPLPMRSKLTLINNVEVPAYRVNRKLVNSTFKFLLDRADATNKYQEIVKDIVNQHEMYASGDYTEGKIEADNYRNMMYEEKDFSKFGDRADMIKSLTVGDGLYTPFWKRFKDKKMHRYQNQQSYKTYDNLKVPFYQKADKVDGCD